MEQNGQAINAGHDVQMRLNLFLSMVINHHETAGLRRIEAAIVDRRRMRQKIGRVLREGML